MEEKSGIITVFYDEENPYQEFINGHNYKGMGVYEIRGASFHPWPDEFMEPIFPFKLGKTRIVKFKIIHMSEIVRSLDWIDMSDHKGFRLANIIELAAFHEQHGFSSSFDIAVLKRIEKKSYSSLGLVLAASKPDGNKDVVDCFYTQSVSSLRDLPWLLLVEKSAEESQEERELMPIKVNGEVHFFSLDSAVVIDGYDLRITEPGFKDEGKKSHSKHPNGCFSLDLPIHILRRVQTTGLSPCTRLYIDDQDNKKLEAYFD